MFESATNKYYLSGIDMFTAYGFFPFPGTSNDLLKPRTRKEPYSNEWAERNGKEYDLASTPTYEDRQFNLKGAIVASSEADFWEKYNAIIGVFSNPGYHILSCTELGEDRDVAVFYKSFNNFNRITPIKSANVIVCEVELILQEIQGVDIFSPAIPPNIYQSNTGKTISATAVNGDVYVNINNGGWVLYSGAISVPNIPIAAGYYKFKTITDDGESTVVESAAFTVCVRYIRDWTTGDSSGNSGGIWCEIMALQGSTNVAFGKGATHSLGSFDFGSGEILTDGVYSYEPYAYKNSLNAPAYVQIDLTQVYENIDTVKVWRYWNFGRTFFNTKTEISIDGVTWKSIFDSAVDGLYVESATGKTINVQV